MLLNRNRGKPLVRKIHKQTHSPTTDRYSGQTQILAQEQILKTAFWQAQIHTHATYREQKIPEA